MDELMHYGVKGKEKFKMENNELMHYGVPGMKWGVKRAQKQYTIADRYASKADQAKNGYQKRRSIRKENLYRTRGDILSNTANAKGLYKKASNLSGYGASRTIEANRSDMYSKMSRTTKGKLSKAIYKQKAANAKENARYWDKKDHMSFGKNIVDNYTNKTFYKTPYHRLSGRVTTRGKDMVDRILTGGIYGAVKDVQYLRSQKK